MLSPDTFRSAPPDETPEPLSDSGFDAMEMPFCNSSAAPLPTVTPAKPLPRASELRAFSTPAVIAVVPV